MLGTHGPRNRNDLFVKVGFYSLVSWSATFYIWEDVHIYIFLPLNILLPSAWVVFLSMHSSLLLWMEDAGGNAGTGKVPCLAFVNKNRFQLSLFRVFLFSLFISSISFSFCSPSTDDSTIASPSLVNYSSYPQQQAFHIISLNQKKTFLFLGTSPASRFAPRSLAHPPRPGLSSYNTSIVCE